MKTKPQHIVLAILILGLTNTLVCIGQTVATTIIYIKHGSSFGECSGYCFYETTINNVKTIEYSKTWGFDKNNPAKTKTLKSEPNNWKALVKSVNLPEFYKLPETIGCPDCTDGGAEWIEIATPKKTYKVTFDYGSDIKPLTELLKLLRY